MYTAVICGVLIL